MWKYKDREINTIEDLPERAYGFIYEVTYIPTGQKYLGKKVLYFKRNVKIGKRELNKIKEERKKQGIGGRPPKRKQIIKESDWKTYYGSQKEVRELVKTDDKNNFKREILEVGFDKKHLTYLETKLLFTREVLEREEYFNDNILGKFYSKDLIKK